MLSSHILFDAAGLARRYPSFYDFCSGSDLDDLLWDSPRNLSKLIGLPCLMMQEIFLNGSYLSLSASSEVVCQSEKHCVCHGLWVKAVEKKSQSPLLQPSQ